MSTDLDDLFSAAVIRGGEHYLDFERSRALVKACTEREVAIIGIEGFEFDGPRIRPRMDLIGDFSDAPGANWREFVLNTAESVSAFLDEADSTDLMFAFVLLQSSESRKFG